MITILNVNKQGNKIVSYTCTDGKETRNLSKDQIVQQINNKNVSNARIQNYKGQIIVRVNDATKSVTKIDNEVNTKGAKKAPYTILNYIDAAKNAGIHTLPLSDIEVNTSNLAIRKVKKTEVALESPAKAESVYDKLSELYSKYFEIGVVSGKLVLLKCKMNQSIVNIPFGISIIADGCFEGLDKVKTITIPLLCVEFQPRAFEGLVSLNNIIISDTSIGESKIKGMVPNNVKLEYYTNRDESSKNDIKEENSTVIENRVASNDDNRKYTEVKSKLAGKRLSSNSDYVIRGFELAEWLAEKLKLNQYEKVYMIVYGGEDIYGWCEAEKVGNKIVECQTEKEFDEPVQEIYNDRYRTLYSQYGDKYMEKGGDIKFIIHVPKGSQLTVDKEDELSNIGIEYNIYCDTYTIDCDNIKDIFDTNATFTYDELWCYLHLVVEYKVFGNLIDNGETYKKHSPAYIKELKNVDIVDVVKKLTKLQKLLIHNIEKFNNKVLFSDVDDTCNISVNWPEIFGEGSEDAVINTLPISLGWDDGFVFIDYYIRRGTYAINVPYEEVKFKKDYKEALDILGLTNMTFNKEFSYEELVEYLNDYDNTLNK